LGKNFMGNDDDDDDEDANWARHPASHLASSSP
jgi:hypothetical protein